MDDATIIVVFFIGGIVYFLPTIIGSNRRASHQSGIFVLNLFLGWTLLGWVVSLVWAVSDTSIPKISQPEFSNNNRSVSVGKKAVIWPFVVFVVALVGVFIVFVSDSKAPRQVLKEAPVSQSSAKPIADRLKDANVKTTPEGTIAYRPNAVAWQSYTEVSKIDDSTNATAHAVAKNSITDRYGNSHTPSLWVACREKRTHLYIQFGGIFVADSGGYGEITLRIDKQQARQISMKESTNNEALGVWNGAGISLIKTMIGKSSLLVVATPYNESSVDMTFPLSGFEAAITPVRKACGW